MLLRYIKDYIMASGNVQVGKNAPFVPAPTLDPVVYVVGDNTPVAPAVVGKTLVLQAGLAATYPGVSQFAANTVATQAVGRGMAGVVQRAAQQTGTANLNEATLVFEGFAFAFVTTTANANKAIAVGDPLVLDGAGNLTSSAANPGTAGTVIAFAGQAVAGGSGAATLIPVVVAGY